LKLFDIFLEIDSYSEDLEPSYSSYFDSFEYNQGEQITLMQAGCDIIKKAIPAVFAMLLRRMIDLSNVIFVGHLKDPDMIAGVGLGTITANVLCFSIALGLSGGIDTLSSQAHGRKEYYLSGSYLNRARVITTLLFIPQAILFFKATDILIYIGQPVASAQYAGTYLKVFSLGVWSVSQMETTRRFLATQGNFNLVVYVQFITL
jgi:MATE family multidrug resistance protein